MHQRRLFLESLEPRRVLAPANVPVNDSAADAVAPYTQYDPALALVNGSVFVGYTDYSAHYLNTTRSPTGYALSADQGQSFTDRGEIANSDEVPSAAYDPSRDRLLTASGENVFHSDDGGASFSTPVHALDRRILHLAVDPFVGDGFGNAYAVSGIGGIFRVDSGIHFARSTDGGVTWSTPISLASGEATGTWLVIAPNHSVFAFWLSSGAQTNTIFMRKSRDGGLTFSPPVKVAEQHGGESGNLNFDWGQNYKYLVTNGFPQVVANPVTGDLYATFADNPPGDDRADIMFTMSNDNGATWSMPQKINDDATVHDQWNPAIAVSPNGQRLFIGYKDRRLDPNNSLVDSFGVLGTIRGSTVSFGSSFRITDTSTPPFGDNEPAAPSNYAGVRESAAADDHWFYYSWADPRNRRGNWFHQQDVFLARIAVTGPAGPQVISQASSGAVINADAGTMRISFSTAMDSTSFTIDDDVLSFSGPNGDLKPGIASSQWIDARTLELKFTPLLVTGDYRLVLGPNILDKGGRPLDNDFNGVAGEVTDRFEIHYTIEPNYSTFLGPVSDALTLTPGAPGVAGPLGDYAKIDLGSRKFTFNNIVYSGTQLSVFRGEIHIGQSRWVDALYMPLEPMETYYAFRDETGDGIPDLIVDFRTGKASFQAVLELGTGRRQGSILLNYQTLTSTSGVQWVRLMDPDGKGPAPFQKNIYVDGYGDFALHNDMSLLIRDMGSPRHMETIAGTAHVFGRPHADNAITLSYDGNSYDINRNGKHQLLDPAGLSHVYLHGAGGNDTLVIKGVRPGDQVGLDGSFGNDALRMDATGPASFWGGGGADRLLGNHGDDAFDGGPGGDLISGGEGSDVYWFGAKTSAGEVDTLQEFPGGGVDTLNLSALPAGVKSVIDLASDTRLVAHGRRIVRTGAAGQAAAWENVFGGAGVDNIRGNNATNRIVGNGGDDLLIGGGGDDILFGGPGNDTLNGDAGNDQLSGGDGNDRYLFGLAVGPEYDRVFEVAGAGTDILDFSPLPANTAVTVNLGQNNLATHAGRKVWAGIKGSFLNFENATGGDGDDTLIGNSGDNRLVGGPGDDTFDGGGGTDQIVQ